jgi:hypothetical protein
MVISFPRILSGLTGFVLLAMPASAAARDHRGPTYQAPPHATGQPGGSTYGADRDRAACIIRGNA